MMPNDIAYSKKLGPLTPLVGEWEGDAGVDLSYHNKDDWTAETTGPLLQRWYSWAGVTGPMTPTSCSRRATWGASAACSHTRFSSSRC